LKAAVYYSDKGSRFNHLAKYWLAESYYRNDDFSGARELFTELYNVSAMYGEPESSLIPYNIAYCFFKERNYPTAARWFGDYLAQPSVQYRKEALERKADCHFITKDYKTAAETYSAVIADYFNADDVYPYYQAALAYGLSKQPDKKIEVLSNVLDASPEAEFYPEALFELGRAYTLKDDDENAFDCFRKLADSVKDSTYVARAYIEMGSLARNQSQFNEALGYYKTVVEKMPMTGYADDALLAIESIYQTRNQPEEYIAYIETIGKGTSKTSDEKEDMIFNSAEQMFLSENYQKALTSLQSYKEKYPQGTNVYKADFYIAESYKALGKKEQACDSYKAVIQGGQGSFVEISMLNFSVLSYQLERWDDAYSGYQSLYSAAKLENNRFAAVTGMMRSAFKGHNWENAVSGAEDVLKDTRSDDQLKQEAEYIMAKSYLAVSRRDEAFVILKRLAEDMASPYGAEAAFMIILDSFDKGDFEDVETKVYAFSDSGSGQTYWLAKSFIVLGDSFAERDELTQAKATFESVRDGYSASADDDIQDSVRMRLEKLEVMIAEKNNR
jgi:TolA-binding protein